MNKIVGRSVGFRLRRRTKVREVFVGVQDFGKHDSPNPRVEEAMNGPVHGFNIAFAMPIECYAREVGWKYNVARIDAWCHIKTRRR